MRVVRLPGIHHDASCVVLSGEEESVVVDPGTSWYQANLVERIEAKLQGHPPVTKILLTHRHFDTAGAAAHLADHWQATVHLHGEGVGALTGGDLFTTWASRFNSDMPPTEPVAMQDGDSFDLGGGVVEVIHTPGHTSDSCCFWLESEHILLAGDLIPKKGHPARWDLPTGCLPDMIESLERISTLDVEQLVCGHGETIVGPAAVLAELEQHHNTLSGIVASMGMRPAEWPRPAATCSWFTPEPPWPE